MNSKRAFTLLEVLIVVGVLALLFSLLIPGLSSARAQAKRTTCASNIRQLALANTMYAQENKSRCVPGAADFVANLKRWHGSRATTAQPFDSANGPLVPYLGTDRAIRDCPALDDFRTNAGAFERGCGGYGYNNAYIGVQGRAMAGGFTIESDKTGTILERIKNPAETLMFSDTAFASAGLIEYSFAEPRFQPATDFRADPSIHFRHSLQSNIAWSDGHVSPERRTFTWSSGLYEGDPAKLNLGWLGDADNNSLFDLE